MMTDGSPGDTPGRSAASLVQSLVLLGAASAAAKVMRAVKERRSGRDPSGQEAMADARENVHRSLHVLQDLVYPLLLSELIHVKSPEEDDAARLVRRFDARHRMAEVAEEIQRIHQRLMSIYPTVDEGVVEEARLLQARTARKLEDDVSSDIMPYLEDVLSFSIRLEAELHRVFSV